jgi:hypothetical protein
VGGVYCTQGLSSMCSVYYTHSVYHTNCVYRTNNVYHTNSVYRTHCMYNTRKARAHAAARLPPKNRGTLTGAGRHEDAVPEVADDYQRIRPIVGKPGRILHNLQEKRRVVAPVVVELVD